MAWVALGLKCLVTRGAYWLALFLIMIVALWTMPFLFINSYSLSSHFFYFTLFFISWELWDQNILANSLFTSHCHLCLCQSCESHQSSIYPVSLLLSPFVFILFLSFLASRHLYRDPSIRFLEYLCRL